MIEVGILVGTVYGGAQYVAEQAEQMIKDKGHSVAVHLEPELADFQACRALVVISSTTGQGDVPPNLEGLIVELRDTFPLMGQKPFAVAGMGDSSYGDTFCGAGRQIFELLVELQGQPVADLLEVDATETLEPETEILPWLERQLPALLEHG